MTLPKLQHTLFEITIPSSGRKMKLRPFLVKEEKILLTAEQSGDVNELLSAIKQVLVNCCVDKKFNPGDIPLFDLEYIFLKLRARSVSNIAEISVVDSDDHKRYNFDINLDTIEVTKNPKHSNKIQLDKNVGLVMKYPSLDLTEKVVNEASNKEMSQEDVDFFITKNCVYQIYDTHQVYTEFTNEELDEFLLNLSRDQSEKVKEFFDTLPKLKYEIHYNNSLGEAKTLSFEGIRDFFQ